MNKQQIVPPIDARGAMRTKLTTKARYRAFDLVRAEDGGTYVIESTDHALEFEVYQPADDLSPQQATQDSQLKQGAPDTNFGTEDTADVTSSDPPIGSPVNTRMILQFDVSGIPAGALINSAALKLTALSHGAGGDDAILAVHRVNESFIEGDVTWNDREAGTPWLSPGGDISAAIANSSTGMGTVDGLKSFDVAILVQQWADGITNNGLMVKNTVENSAAAGVTWTFATKEHATVENRPVLEVNYSAAGGTVTVELPATSSGKRHIVIQSPVVAGQYVTLTPSDGGTVEGEASLTLPEDEGERGAFHDFLSGGDVGGDWKMPSTTSHKRLKGGGGVYTHSDLDDIGNSQYHSARAYRATSAQSHASSGNEVKIELNAESWDLWDVDEFDPTTNFRFTPLVAGKYQVNAAAEFAASALGTRHVAIYKNGARVSKGVVVAGLASVISVGVSDIIDMDGVDDYIEIFAFQDSGGNLDINFGSDLTYASFQHVGP